MSTSLAVKYRPKTFEDVTEQSIVTDILESICNQKDMPCRNFLLIGPAGTGKALTLDTKLLTPKGYVEMRHIKIGDEVFTGEGHPATVTGVFPQGEQMTYRIILDDNSYVDVSEDHINCLQVWSKETESWASCTMLTSELYKNFTEPDSDFKNRCGVATPPIEFRSCDFDIQYHEDDPFRFGFDLMYNESVNIEHNHTRLAVIPRSHNKTSYRLNILRGMIMSAKTQERFHDIESSFEIKQREYIYTINEPQISKFFEFLVRSLGIVDRVEPYSYRVSEIEFRHHLIIPEEIEILLFHSINPKVCNRDTVRHISMIVPLEMQECQCIYVNDACHTFIVNDGFIPTHNTTCARIMSNKLNDGIGSPIEIDAASHGNVENIRELVSQAKQYPVGQNYKIFIVDECFSGDTEVLTNKGFVRFDEVNKEMQIAQFNLSDCKISFTDEYEYIHKHYNDDMIKFYPKGKEYQNGNCYVRMTKNHVQPFYNIDTKSSVEYYAHDLIEDENAISTKNKIYRAGIGDGNVTQPLTNYEKFVIMSCMMCNRTDETRQVYYGEKADELITENRWFIKTHNFRNIYEIEHVLKDNGIKYDKFTTYNHDTVKKNKGYYEISYYLPEYIGQTLSDVFSTNVSYERASAIIEEIFNWRGQIFSENHYRITSRHKGNIDAISIFGILSGWAVDAIYTPYKSKTGKDKQTKILDLTKTSLRYYKKPYAEIDPDCDEDVYCVKVPTQNIIVRAHGTVFVTGNCHSISNTGWQSLLKVLEESPARTVWIFATTNPEKIPDTILSRVQTFQLSKISLKGIYDRLIHVIECENEEGRNITYTEDAVNYIAKMANGGMRDSLTLLDKALAYSTDLSSENISKALNLLEYDDYFALLSAYSKKDNKEIASIVDRVYNSGVNFVKWFESFHSFVMNIVKYIFLQDINMTMIPTTYQEKISKYSTKHTVVCLKLANKLVKLNQELKSTQYLQELALTYLCSVPSTKKQ